MAADAEPSEIDVVAELRRLAQRLDWACENDWLADQPEWLRRYTRGEGRDPVDNGVNILVMVDGLRAAVRGDDEAAALLAQLSLLPEIGEFAQVAFQPIVDVEAQTVRGFEALLRWDSPDLGRLPPPLVIEVAERYGAIGRLEEHIVTSAVSAAAQLREVAPDCRVNINLTAKQLAGPAMTGHLIAECERVGVPGAGIVIELTESALIDHRAASASLDALAEHGFAIALDDFGTGYSNLAYLVEMRNVGLKIDGSFVRNMLEDDRAEMVCRMLINAASTLGAPIVAEQVEDDGHVAALRALGCVLHQAIALRRRCPLTKPRRCWPIPRVAGPGRRRAISNAEGVATVSGAGPCSSPAT